jgi:hypothetical protein
MRLNPALRDDAPQWPSHRCVFPNRPFGQPNPLLAPLAPLQRAHSEYFLASGHWRPQPMDVTCEGRILPRKFATHSLPPLLLPSEPPALPSELPSNPWTPRLTHLRCNGSSGASLGFKSGAQWSLTRSASSAASFAPVRPYRWNHDSQIRGKFSLSSASPRCAYRAPHGE